MLSSPMSELWCRNIPECPPAVHWGLNRDCSSTQQPGAGHRPLPIHQEGTAGACGKGSRERPRGPAGLPKARAEALLLQILFPDWMFAAPPNGKRLRPPHSLES